MAGGDPWLQHAAEAQAGYNQAVAAAKAAAAAGNADLTTTWLKAADGYRAEYEAAERESIKLQLGRSRPLTDDEAANLPAGTNPKEFQITGSKIEHIGGTEEAKDTTEVQNYKSSFRTPRGRLLSMRFRLPSPGWLKA
jgi:hypothetical protein